MGASKAMEKMSGVAAAALLLLCCTGSGVQGEYDDWKVSLVQSTDVPSDAIALAGKTSPQFKSNRYSATVVPLGQSVKDGFKITRFALSADLPRNCRSSNGKTYVPDGGMDGSDPCLDFTVIVAGPKVVEEGAGAHLSRVRSGLSYVETPHGMSIFEFSSPLDTDKIVVNFLTDGSSSLINVLTGEVMMRNFNGEITRPSKAQSE